MTEKAATRAYAGGSAALASTGMTTRSGARAVSAIAAAWVLSLGVDLLLHAGLLARLYVAPSPFLLQPDQAFRRIPLGYLAFLGLTIGLYWLLRRLTVRGAMAGLQLGAVAGSIVWGTFVVGLYSISTASPALLAGWWVGQTLELSLAGAVLGAAFAGRPMTRLWLIVSIVVAVCVIATVTLESLGLAPAMRIAT